MLLHQVHAVKPGVDAAAAPASNVLVWRRHPHARFVVRFVGPAVRLRRPPSRTGRPGAASLESMPHTFQLLRDAGDTIMPAERGATVSPCSLPGWAHLGGPEGC